MIRVMSGEKRENMLWMPLLMKDRSSDGRRSHATERTTIAVAAREAAAESSAFAGAKKDILIIFFGCVWEGKTVILEVCRFGNECKFFQMGKSGEGGSSWVSETLIR